MQDRVLKKREERVFPMRGSQYHPMVTSEINTSPLPTPIREPLLMLIDAHDVRHRWVVSLLAFANYHVYAI